MTKKFIPAIIAAMAMTSHHTCAQLMVDYRTAVRDSLTGDWLCSMPEDVFGHDLTTQITYNGASMLTVDGQAVVDNQTTFRDISGDKAWTITTTNASGQTETARLQFTFLPIVVIEANVTTTYTDGTVSVLLPDEDIVSPCKVKFRGSSTNRDTYFKRNYHLKFVNEAGEKTEYRFFDGLRKDNSWLLDGGTIDHIRVRNRALTDLWLDMNSRPYYADIEENALNGVRGKMVEVYRNGEYQGVYNMCEAMDRKQLKLKKFDETTKQIYGQLWKSGTRTTTTMMRDTPECSNRKDHWNGFEVQYPDYEDVHPTEFKNLYDVTNLCAHSTDQEFDSLASKLIDMPVLRDMYVFTQTILAYDNLGKNVYWATHDRTESPMLTPIPWDFDTSLGGSWSRNEYHPDYLSPESDVFTQWAPDNFYMRFIKWNVDGFADKAAARYRELRTGLLSNESLFQRLRDYIDMFKKSGTASREEYRWRKTTDLGKHPLSFDGEYAYITEFMTKRFQWLDEYFKERVNGDANGDGVVDVSDSSMCTDYILGKANIPEVYTYKLDAERDMVIDVNDNNRITNIILKK